MNGRSQSYGALAIMGGTSVQVADGDGEGVGGVCGMRDLFEAKQTRDHELHLGFFGLAVSDDGGLDGQRGVLSDFNFVRRGSQHGYATDLSELERGFHVDRVEDIFNGDTVGPAFQDEGAEFVEDR